MSYDRDILDRKVGRNAQLFAQAIARLDTARARFPYLRILVCLIEKAHPEWTRPEPRPRRVARLAEKMSGGALCPEEVAAVAQARDDERSPRSNGQKVKR
ncbi:MAG: DUF4290 domain-containing protein [Bacteroidetes bacterium QS_9_68_14]|nr:MAG: DUF4290 domain-containing protein [Bacteroidetes bacterium QS_9_68_14]